MVVMMLSTTDMLETFSRLADQKKDAYYYSKLASFVFVAFLGAVHKVQGRQ